MGFMRGCRDEDSGVYGVYGGLWGFMGVYGVEDNAQTSVLIYWMEVYLHF